MSHQKFSDLNAYLADDNGVQAFQLSQQIAALFDQYLIYRPDLINAWESGADQHWQATLWRAIKKDETAAHWGRIKERIAIIAGMPPDRNLPKRISVFGVADMPPLYTEILSAVSRHTVVCIYYLNPCQEYWADIENEKQQVRRRMRARQAGQQDPTALLRVS